MANFLSGSACRGVRPKSVELKNKYSREHLISKLMTQRNVVRFIHAPNGFGKSTLAAQYAQLVFAFRDVFWINCKSPCFIRDLDSDVIAKELVKISKNPKLVVFDDLSILSEDRQTKFSDLIDELLEFDCEVIVISSEENEIFTHNHTDAMIISATDMLLNESEYDLVKDKFNDNVQDGILKIPVIAWNKDGTNLLLKQAVHENFTNDIMFTLFYIYLFKTGKISSIKKYISKSSFHLLKDVNKQFIYFGIDWEYDMFNVLDVSVHSLKAIFINYRQLILSYFGVNDNLEFANKILLMYEDNKQYKRATEFVNCFGNKELKTNFLEKYNEVSIKDMFMVEASSLYESITISKKDSCLNKVFQSLRLAILSYRKDAIRLSYSVLDNNESHIDNKLFASLIFMRFGDQDEKFQAIKIIRYLNNDFKIEKYLNSTKISNEIKDKCIMIHKVADVYLAINSENINPFDVWLNSVDDKISNADLLSAECLFNSCQVIQQKYIESDACLKFILRLARNFNLGAKYEFNFYTYALVNSFLKAREYMEQYCGTIPWEVNEQVMANYEYFDKNLKLSRNRFFLIHKINFSSPDNNNLSDFEAMNRIGINYKKIIPSKYITDTDIPKLYIQIFGGLSVYIGGREIIQTDFGRQNIKLICCILTIENGQEINKDKIASIVWPDSDFEQRRINMNTHWSNFRKFLTLSNGNCPYLLRSQNSYKLNKQYFTSDLQQLEDLCTDLTMGSLDSQAWLEKLNNSENILNGDLLPSETNNAYIRIKRSDYKNMIVNALIAASERLLEAGEIQQSLWFANKAYYRDNNREDVYEVLMRAQMEAGQRTPAIETYFACKKFLENDLGIEPSYKIKNLYDEVMSTTN